MSNLNAVILDETSFNNNGDMDLTNLLALNDNWARYDETAKDERLERLQNVQIAVANKIVFDKELLEQLPDLKVILLAATGMDNIDRDYCEANGIAYYNVTDYCTASLAQHVFTLILSLSTSINDYQRITRNGEWSKSAHFCTLQFPIQELAGKTLGLIGYGSLAKGVEKLAKAFDMNIMLGARVGSSEAPEGRVLIEDMLPQVDVLSVHCPLTPETNKMINYDFLSKMKSTAFIINSARGAVIDNADLAQALRDGVIAGAGIDVLEVEPPPADHPLLDPDIPNLILTPHVAWAAKEARQRVVEKVAANLKNWLSTQS